LTKLTGNIDLPMSLSGHQWAKHSGAMCSRAWCAQWPGFKPPPDDEQGDNPRHEKEGSTVSSINCDHCWHLDLAASGCWPRWHGWSK